MIRNFVIIICLLSFVSGCFDKSREFSHLRGFVTAPTEVTESVRAAVSIEIYSLQPWGTAEPIYREHSVYQQATIKEASEIKDVFLMFSKIIKDDGDWYENDCFDPRIVLVCESGDLKSEILLSFECGKGEIYKGENKSEFTLSQTSRREFEAFINSILAKNKTH